MLELKPFGAKAHKFIYRHPSQDRHITILEGSVRSSKTVTMLMKLRGLMSYNVQGTRVIAGVSKESVYQNVLSDLFDLIGPTNYKFNRSSGALRLFNSMWRVVGANDDRAERYIRGSTIGVAYVDEGTLIPKSFMLMLKTRLSPPGSRLYITTNPDSPYHYLKEEFIDKREHIDAGDIETIHFTLDDNPNLDHAYKERIRRSYHGLYHKRFVLGQWVMAEGAIYADCFTDDLYYSDATAPLGLGNQGSYVQRFIGVDYGTTNPCVFLEFLDDGKRLWLTREYYWDSKVQRRQKTDSEYAADLKKFIEGYDPIKGELVHPYNRNDAQVIMDPSAASFKLECTKQQVWVTDADNDVDGGIRYVSSMFSQKMIRINKQRCPNYVAEHQTYSWDEKASQRGEEKPIKFKDHTCDGERYVVKTKINPWRLGLAA